MFQKFKEWILAIPLVYNLVQWIFVAPRGKEILVEHMDVQSGQTVLDIGCGTSIYLEYFPPVKYVGYDLNEEYLVKSRDKYGHLDAEFHCKTVSEMNLPDELRQKCDRVLVLSVLHHLSDDEVKDLFATANAALKPGGKMISVDPTFVDNQNWIAYRLVAADRGNYVRHFDEYRDLYDRFFQGDFEIYGKNLVRFPYNHAIVVGTRSG